MKIHRLRKIAPALLVGAVPMCGHAHIASQFQRPFAAAVTPATPGSLTVDDVKWAPKGTFAMFQLNGAAVRRLTTLLASGISGQPMLDLDPEQRIRGVTLYVTTTDDGDRGFVAEIHTDLTAMDLYSPFALADPTAPPLDTIGDGQFHIPSHVPLYLVDGNTATNLQKPVVFVMSGPQLLADADPNVPDELREALTNCDRSADVWGAVAIDELSATAKVYLSGDRDSTLSISFADAAVASQAEAGLRRMSNESTWLKSTALHDKQRLIVTFVCSADMIRDLSNGLRQARDSALRLKTHTKLRQLFIALSEYGEQHDGLCPPSLNTLVQCELLDSDALVDAWNRPFVYTPPSTGRRLHSSQVVLLAYQGIESSEIPTGLALFTDGAVRSLSRSDLDAEITRASANDPGAALIHDRPRTPARTPPASRHARQLAQHQANMLANAVRQLILDYNHLPRYIDIEALLTDPDDPEDRRWSGPYVPSSESLVDPWGHRFVLRIPGEANVDFDIVSFGSDGTPGGVGDEADIVAPTKVEVQPDATPSPQMDAPSRAAEREMRISQLEMEVRFLNNALVAARNALRVEREQSRLNERTHQETMTLLSSTLEKAIEECRELRAHSLTLASHLREAEAHVQEVQDRLEDYAQRCRSLQEQVEALNGERQALIQRLAAVAGGESDEVASADGKVVAYDERTKTVTISIGRNHRVMPGLTFAVLPPGSDLRGVGIDQVMSRKALLRVKSSSETSAVCDVVETTRGERIHEGDAILNPVFSSTKNYAVILIGVFEDDPLGGSDRGRREELTALLQAPGCTFIDDHLAAADLVIRGRRPDEPPRPSSTESVEKLQQYMRATRERAIFDQVMDHVALSGQPMISEAQLIALLGLRRSVEHSSD